MHDMTALLDGVREQHVTAAALIAQAAGSEPVVKAPADELELEAPVPLASPIVGASAGGANVVPVDSAEAALAAGSAARALSARLDATTARALSPAPGRDIVLTCATRVGRTEQTFGWQRADATSQGDIMVGDLLHERTADEHGWLKRQFKIERVLAVKHTAGKRAPFFLCKLRGFALCMDTHWYKGFRSDSTSSNRAWVSPKMKVDAYPPFICAFFNKHPAAAAAVGAELRRLDEQRRNYGRQADRHEHEHEGGDDAAASGHVDAVGAGAEQGTCRRRSTRLVAMVAAAERVAPPGVVEPVRPAIVLTGAERNELERRVREAHPLVALVARLRLQAATPRPHPLALIRFELVRRAEARQDDGSW